MKKGEKKKEGLRKAKEGKDTDLGQQTLLYQPAEKRNFTQYLFHEESAKSLELALLKLFLRLMAERGAGSQY